MRYHVIGSGREKDVHANLGGIKNKSMESYMKHLRDYDYHTNQQLVQSGI